ncbi:MAG: site-specific integrase [Bacteroidaceae bacterium]|nr:site-specific integrase [Bacteroidaceae bacterium]
MKEKRFTDGIKNYMAQLEEEGRYSTAKSYRDAWRSFTTFCGTDDIPYSFITKALLRRYEVFLLQSGCMRNTVSTYMRRLRCIYNRAVETGEAKYVPGLFREVFTGIESIRKRSLPLPELHRLMTVPVRTPSLRATQLAVCLMFQYGGIPFVDFAHLKSGNLHGSRLSYHRKKTGTPISLEMLDSSYRMLQELSHHTRSSSPFLFPFLSGEKQGRAGYQEYRYALQRFNGQLKVLSRCANLRVPVTSYSIRHSFANLLKEQQVPVEVISELLGHRSIRTTQIYLRSFSLDRLKEVTDRCFREVFSYKEED